MYASIILDIGTMNTYISKYFALNDKIYVINSEKSVKASKIYVAKIGRC